MRAALICHSECEQEKSSEECEQEKSSEECEQEKSSEGGGGRSKGRDKWCVKHFRNTSMKKGALVSRA